MNPAWFVVVPMALLPLIFHWMPLWRRNGIWFGVTVAPGHSDTPEARAVLSRFRIAVWLVALVAVAAATLSPAAISPWAYQAIMTLEIAGALAAFVRARRQTLPHAVPPAPRSASLTAEPERLPGGIAAALAPFVILGAAALYLYSNWDGIPERIAVHWDILGAPDRWDERTWTSVFAPLIAGAVEAAFMLLVAFGILRASPRGRVAANAAATAQFRRVMLQFLMAVIWGMSLLLAAFAVIPRTGVSFGSLPQILILGLMVIPIVFVWRLVGLARTYGSGAGGDGTPDACWKLGMVYYNPADPAIFVEQRLGIGYTCNFGNRMTWLFLGTIVLLGMVPLVLRSL